MATTKAPVKKAAKKVSEKSAAPKKAKKATGLTIDQTMQSVLDKLSHLGADRKLQDDIKWCLGSYGFDKNPVGLYETGARALALLKDLKAKKSKGVTAKLVGDLEKALKQK